MRKGLGLRGDAVEGKYPSGTLWAVAIYVKRTRGRTHELLTWWADLPKHPEPLKWD